MCYVYAFQIEVLHALIIKKTNESWTFIHNFEKFYRKLSLALSLLFLT